MADLHTVPPQAIVVNSIQAIRAFWLSKSEADEISVGLLQKLNAVLDSYERVVAENVDLKNSLGQLTQELESANKAASTYLKGLTKRIGELEEALEPFAEAWNQWRADEWRGDEHGFIEPYLYVDDPNPKLEQAAKAFKGE